MPRKHKNDRPIDHLQTSVQKLAHSLELEAATLPSNMTEPARDELLDQGHMRRTTIMPSFEHGEKYHEAGKRDVELYIRTYNTLLRSSGDINLKALVQAHYNIDSSLHSDARKPNPGMSAFIYSVLRLPTEINQCN